MGAERKNTPTNVPTNTNVSTSVVVINNLYSKLQFVKAIKEAKHLPLKEAKDLVDEILITKEGSFAEFYSLPFIIGNSMDSKFSKKEWELVCRYFKDGMVWDYV